MKELRLAGISDTDAGNAHLPGFMERFNSQFAVAPAWPANRHRPLEVTPERLREILCHREQRHVGHQLTLCYQRKRIMLQETPVARGLVGQYVDTYAFPDGSLELRWQGIPLPYTAFDKDQRVQHAAVVENKRLGEALRYVQELQATLPAPRVKSNAEKSGYQRRGRASRRVQSFLEKRAADKADRAEP